MTADDADDALDLRRRRRRKAAAHRRRLLLAGGLAILAAAACGVAVTLAVGRVRDAGGGGVADKGGGGGAAGAVTRPLFGGPSPGSEGETWDHQELAAYLRSRGLTVHSTPTGRGAFFGPACEFRESTAGPEVWVMKWPSQQAAKDRSGGSPQPTFAWGRFCFNGEPGTDRFIESMRSALGAR